MYKKAVSKYSYMLQYCPCKYITKKMCDIYSWWLFVNTKFLPDCFATSTMLDNLDYYFFFNDSNPDYHYDNSIDDDDDDDDDSD